MEKQNSHNNSHVAPIKKDKCLLCDIFSGCIGGKKEVYFFPDEVFVDRDISIGEEIFFIPTLPASTDISVAEESDRIPMPIFMIDFTSHQRGEIMRFGAINGLEIGVRHFCKPKVTLTYELREELDLDLIENNYGIN